MTCEWRRGELIVPMAIQSWGSGVEEVVEDWQVDFFFVSHALP